MRNNPLGLHPLPIKLCTSSQPVSQPLPLRCFILLINACFGLQNRLLRAQNDNYNITDNKTMVLLIRVDAGAVDNSANKKQNYEMH